MKTPKDLTQKQKELIGLFTEVKYDFHSLAENDLPLYVVPDTETFLHKSGLKMYCQIWQLDKLVGKVTVEFDRNDVNLALYFIVIRAKFESYADDKDAIDRLLEILEKNNE